MNNSLKTRAELARKLTLIPLLALIVLFILWRTLLIPAQHGWTIIAIHSVPLLLFLPGMLGRRPKVYIWFCFVILLYFCQGVMGAFTLPSILGVIGAIETLLTVWAFCAAMLAARYYARLGHKL
ncbi:MAG: DUF2069 domain-containing protein [Pseudomonadota bacterium]|nr:hypothetical protein [Pseudomonadales bacterium]MDY6922209.1 DUF2069 domain-containing protein [Pseudomonadota bacterium]